MFYTAGKESNWQYLKRMFKEYGVKGFFEGLVYLWRMRWKI